MLQIVSLYAECKKFWKVIAFTKKILDERNYSFKTMVHKPLLKTLGSYLICQCK